MKTTLVILLAVFSTGYAQLEEQQCKPNESFTTCGSACEPSCEKPFPTICTLQCIIGCQCNKGFFRNSNGDCVKMEECKKTVTIPSPSPIQCAINETFSDCHNSCMEAKCEPKDTPIKVCPASCHQGCGCSTGFVRVPSTGKCIQKSDCKELAVDVTPQKCPVNETFTTCHNPCTEKKCPMRNAPMISCLLACQTGCGCSEGFVRNMQGQCVRSSDCPRISLHDSNNSASTPDENPCNLVDCKPGMKCELQTGEPKCVKVKRSLTCATMLCRNGFVCKDTNGRGRCVPAEDSTPSITCANVRCGSQAGCAMVMSGGCSSMTCAQPSCVDTNPCAATSCPVGSECILRQVQCFAPPCNPIAECFTPQQDNSCPLNEETVACKSACSEFKCGQTEPVMCTRDCKGPGCACKKGFFRNHIGKCVTQNQCDLLRGK